MSDDTRREQHEQHEQREQEATPAGQDDRWQIVPDSLPYEDGFSSRIIWAAFFVGLVMLPGAIYLELVTGKSFAGAAEWVTIIMFIEIGKRLFIKLKPQEAIILYWLAAGLRPRDWAPAAWRPGRRCTARPSPR